MVNKISAPLNKPRQNGRDDNKLILDYFDLDHDHDLLTDSSEQWCELLVPPDTLVVSIKSLILNSPSPILPAT